MKKILIAMILKFIQADFWLGLLTGFFAWVIHFVAPTWPFILLMMSLVLVDLFTGVRAAKKRGEPIQSKKLRRTVEKISLYGAAILLSKGMEDVFNLPVDVTYMAAFAICLTEVKSNFENIYEVTGTDVWSSIIDMISPKKK